MAFEIIKLTYLLIYASLNAVTCLTSPQRCQCINSLLVGMQVALKCYCPLVKIGFSLFCLKVTVTQQLAYVIFEMVHSDWAYNDTSQQTSNRAIKLTLVLAVSRTQK